MTLGSVESLISDLSKQQANYIPAEGVQRDLASKRLIMLISATSMGKSSLMNELNQLYPEIAIAGTIKTRPKRADDDMARYTFYSHDEVGLSQLKGRVERGELVQYVVDDYTGYVSGSAPSDYPSAVNIGDYYSFVYEQFLGYGFKEVMPISVITDPDVWQKRFDNRFSPEDPQRKGRIAEAIASLSWSLEQGKYHKWVINQDGELVNSAEDLKQIIDGQINHAYQARAQSVAEACLSHIKQLEADQT